MNAKAKFLANERRDELFASAEWKSVVSGRWLREGIPQLAHRVARTKSHIEKWGDEVVNHPLNMVPVLDLNENAACNLAKRRAEAHALMERIIRITTGRESEPDMSHEYAELRRQFAETRILDETDGKR